MGDTVRPTPAWQVLCLLALGAPGAAQIAAPASGERLTDLTGEWQFDHKAILGPSHNLYNARVVEVPDAAYPFRMWFFGYAVQDSNPWGDRFPRDAIFHGRSHDLRRWEVHAGSRQSNMTSGTVPGGRPSRLPLALSCMLTTRSEATCVPGSA